MDDTVRNQAGDLGEDRIKDRIALSDGQGIVEVDAGIDGGQMQFFTLFGDVA